MRERNPRNPPDYCLVFKGRYILDKGTQGRMVKRCERVPASVKGDYEVKHINECNNLKESPLLETNMKMGREG